MTSCTGSRMTLFDISSRAVWSSERWIACPRPVRSRSNSAAQIAIAAANACGIRPRDAVAALVSSGEFLATPEPLRMQLQVVSRFARVPGFVVMASPRLQTQTAQAARTALLAFDGRSALGQSFFRQTGLQGMRVLPDGQMEAMDPLVASTRALLQEAP